MGHNLKLRTWSQREIKAERTKREQEKGLDCWLQMRNLKLSLLDDNSLPFKARIGHPDPQVPLKSGPGGLDWGCCPLSHGWDGESLTWSTPAHMCTPWTQVPTVHSVCLVLGLGGPRSYVGHMCMGEHLIRKSPLLPTSPPKEVLGGSRSSEPPQV